MEKFRFCFHSFFWKVQRRKWLRRVSSTGFILLLHYLSLYRLNFPRTVNEVSFIRTSHRLAIFHISRTESVRTTLLGLWNHLPNMPNFLSGTGVHAREGRTVERFCGDRRPLSGVTMQIHGGRVNDRITDRVVPRTDDLVSLVSRAPERGSTRSQSVHRRDKCQGQTREPKFRHFTVRYVFGYSPANVLPPFSSLRTILPQAFRIKLCRVYVRFYQSSEIELFAGSSNAGRLRVAVTVDAFSDGREIFM